MSTTTAYQDLVALKFSASSFNWNGTNHSQLMLNTGVTIPAGVSAISSIGPATGNGSGSTEFVFINPMPYDFVAVIDGTMQGNIKCGVRYDSPAAATDYIELQKVELQLSALTDDGVSRPITEYVTIWTGALRAGVGETKTLGTMFWVTVSDTQIQSNERLVASIRLSYYVNDTLSREGSWVYLYCDQDNQDTMLSLPFVMG